MGDLFSKDFGGILEWCVPTPNSISEKWVGDAWEYMSLLINWRSWEQMHCNVMEKFRFIWWRCHTTFYSGISSSPSGFLLHPKSLSIATIPPSSKETPFCFSECLRKTFLCILSQTLLLYSISESWSQKQQYIRKGDWGEGLDNQENLYLVFFKFILVKLLIISK